MRFETQPVKLPVSNTNTLVQTTLNKVKRHESLLSDSIREVFCRPPNCGKINTLFSLILHPNGLTFENIYLYSKSLQQPKYKFLEKVLNDVEGIEYFPFSGSEQVLSPGKAKPNSIFIFILLVRNKTVLEPSFVWVVC